MEKQTEITGSNDIQPGIVTGISFQKKRADRRSVFIDGKYSFSISEQTFQAFPLKVNQYLSTKQIAVIKNHEEFEKTKDLALQYISIRMRSEFELRQYLRRKECDAANISRVLLYCHARKFLNDKEYAEMLTRDMININKYGRNKMYATLRKRGISSEIVAEVLQAQVEEKDQLKIAENLALKKIKTIKDESKIREKLYRYLKQRGFSYDIISAVVNRLKNI